MTPAHANGAAHLPSRVASPRGRDPMAAVLALGRNASRVVPLTLFVAFAMHGTAAARAAFIPIELMRWSQAIGREIQTRIVETYDIDVAKPPEPPPPPPPEPEKDEPKVAPAPREAKVDTPQPAAEAAKAGAILAQQPDPNEPVDLTNAFMTGNADTYAGGVTQSTGTSDSAVYARKVAPGGSPGGTGKAPGPPATAVDRSRAASLAGSKDWKCDFPPEADIDQVDQAFVVVMVATRADGSPDHVSILSDPGHGFARAARICAMKEHYDPALDHDGNPVAGQTKSIRIRFER
jgi:periplasmic protein TonB